jgi:carotenoid 1,2-hydratase
MIDIGSSRQEMHPRFLEAPGGFAWWYVDLVTPEGDGLVLIWSYGLPFLPGYAAAARRGRPQAPRGRSSLNVVLYERGLPVFYLLQEYGTERKEERGKRKEVLQLTDRGARLELERSSFESRVEGSRRVVEVKLDCAVPGTTQRLTGTVRMDGVARRGAEGAPEPPDAPHVWTPLTGPARGAARLEFGGQPLKRLEGRAYHDRNGSSVPLHELGIGHWMWGRLPFGERERIYYLLWPMDPAQPPRCLGMEIDRAGNTRLLEGLRVERQAERRTLAGLRWAERLRLFAGDRLWLELRHRVVADSGPFYLRFLSDATAPDGERATGWGELCYPDRVDRAVHRPLVRMKVHRHQGGNSLWVPLFTGPRSGRLGRLFRHLLSAAHSR